MIEVPDNEQGFLGLSETCCSKKKARDGPRMTTEFTEKREVKHYKVFMAS